MSDRLARSMTPIAAALAVAVADHNADEVANLIVGLSRNQMNALAVVLAAHVDPDKPFKRVVIANATQKAASRAAVAFGLHPSEVMSTSRRREVLDARAVTYYAAHLAGDNYSQIGRVMDRDHSTVAHALSRVGTDRRLRRIAKRIARDLGWDRNAEEAA